MQSIGKLVRDKIADIINERGERAITRTLKGDELSYRILMKIQEETAELLGAKGRDEILEEMADLMEVLDAYRKDNKITLKELKEARKAKVEKRGAFKDGLFLVGVAEPLTEEEAENRAEAERLSNAMKNVKHTGSTVVVKY